MKYELQDKVTGRKTYHGSMREAQEYVTKTGREAYVSLLEATPEELDAEAAECEEESRAQMEELRQLREENKSLKARIEKMEAAKNVKQAFA